MKLDRPLSPPLETIERRLFGVSPALIAAVEAGQVSPAIAEAVKNSPEWVARGTTEELGGEVAVAVPAMPAHIREAIARRVTARSAFGDGRHDPAPGQIVEVREIRTPRQGQLDWVMQAPLYVLLEGVSETPGVWHGWLASSESDYAGWWDFVLQEEDLPFDPEAGVVHLWNPVRLYLPMAGRVVAVLTPARLQAVRALAAEYLTGEIPPGTSVWPGRVASRETTGGIAVATGSPLGGASDPRHRFQHLYFHAAEAVREPARLAMAEQAKAPVRSLTSLLSALTDAVAGGLRTLPRVELAMSDSVIPESSPEDLVWDDLARISIREVDPDGSGALRIMAIGTSPVVCELRVGDVLENRVTALPAGAPAMLAWDGADRPHLVLTAEDGRRLDLLLVP